MKTPEQYVNLLNVNDIVLMSLLLTLRRFHPNFHEVSIVGFEQVNAS